MSKRKRESAAGSESQPIQKLSRTTNANSKNEVHRNDQQSMNITKTGNTETTPPKSKSSDVGGDESNLRTINLMERKGDLFAAPPKTLLIHACNSQGHWGKGIALAFRERYPQAYKAQQQYCKSIEQGQIPGTALLVPPAEDLPEERRHFVGCLFTSLRMGRAKDKPVTILGNTGSAMSELLRQVCEWNQKESNEVKVEAIWMCQINSGLFNVPWEDTKKVLERVSVPEELSTDVIVMTR